MGGGHPAQDGGVVGGGGVGGGGEGDSCCQYAGRHGDGGNR